MFILISLHLYIKVNSSIFTENNYLVQQCKVLYFLLLVNIYAFIYKVFANIIEMKVGCIKQISVFNILKILVLVKVKPNTNCEIRACTAVKIKRNCELKQLFHRWESNNQLSPMEIHAKVTTCREGIQTDTHIILNCPGKIPSEEQ